MCSDFKELHLFGSNKVKESDKYKVCVGWCWTAAHLNCLNG